MEQDTIQINAPDFDPDIDRPNPPRTHYNTAIVSVQEHQLHLNQKSLMPQISKRKIHTKTHRNPHTTILRSPMQNYTTEQSQITSGYSINPEEIPQLEEDWNNHQFADADTNLINRHNTHTESERIRREYIQHLLELSDNQYYYEENPINQLQYSSSDPDYHRTPTRQKKPHNPNGYYPPPPDPADVQHWHACGRGKHTLLHGHRLFSEKTLSTESRKARKRRKKLQAMNEKVKFLTILLFIYI